jgi:hypothetical protein
MFVIGGLYGGFFTPTEAGGVGASGAFLLGVLRGKLDRAGIREALLSATRTSAAVFTVLIGALLFGYGANGYRFMDKHATIMIHDVSLGAGGKIEEIKADAKEGERLNQIVYREMAANCGKEAEFFLKEIHGKSHADWYLDAKEAKSIGLANHLRVPDLKIKISVKYSFE